MTIIDHNITKPRSVLLNREIRYLNYLIKVPGGVVMGCDGGCFGGGGLIWIVVIIIVFCCCCGGGGLI